MPTVVVVVVCLIVVSIWLVVRRGLQMSRLARDGIATSASILTKVRFRGRSGVPVYKLRYAFTAPDGQQYEGTVSLTETESAGLADGGTIDITYLPDSPQVSGVTTTVALAREALRKKSGTQ